jgi:hypothetical protein
MGQWFACEGAVYAAVAGKHQERADSALAGKASELSVN